MISAVLLNDTSSNNHHGCTKVVDNIEKYFNEIGIKLIYKHPVGSNWYNNGTYLDHLSKSEVLIINAEGTIHHGQERGHQLLKSIPDAIKKGKKVLLLNMTYQNNPDEFTGYLSIANLITVRESYSKRELLKAGIESQIIPDFTFYNFKESNEIANTNDTTLVTDSVYYDLTLKLKDLSQGQKKRFFPVLEKNPNELLWSQYFHFFFKIPSRLTLYKIFTQPHKLLQEYIKNQRLYENYCMDHHKYIEQLNLSNGIITARFHTLCFAIQQKKKFVAIKSNSFKVESMLSDIGLNNERIINEATLSNKKLIINDFSEDELQRINTYIRESQKAFINLKEMIQHTLN